MPKRRERDRRRLFFLPSQSIVGGILCMSLLFFALCISLHGQSQRPAAEVPSTAGSIAGNSLTPPPSPIVDTIFSAPDTAYFGLVHVHQCDTLGLPMSNNGIDPIIVDSVRLTSKSSPSPLFLIDLFPNPVTIGFGSKEIVRIGFCPDDSLCHTANVAIYAHSVATPGEMILHTVGIQGCGGSSIIKVDQTQINFGSVFLQKCVQEQVVVQNTGNYPLHIGSITTTTPDFRIVDPTRFPVTVAPYSSKSIIVEFCPSAIGTIADVLTILSDAENPLPPLPLEGKGKTYQLSLPDTLDVGAIPLGLCVDTFVVVQNIGSTPITLTEIVLDDNSLPTGFSLLTQIPTGSSRNLDPGDTIRVRVRFCPPGEGEEINSLSVIDDGGDSEIAQLRGSGIVPQVWLDTTMANAGEIALLNFRIGPGDVTGPGTYHAELQFDSDALFPVRVEEATGDGSVGIASMSKGYIVVDGKRGGSLPSDGTLFKIAFRGLATGQPINSVTIAKVQFSNPITRWNMREGIVLLNGCDVGTIPGVGKRAHISTIGPNPAGESVLLTYQAPLGRHPILTLFDYVGNRLMIQELPEGTGTLQEFRLDVSGLSGGLYLMELKERDERSLRTLMIDQ